MPINTVTYHPKEKSIKIKKDIFYLEKSLTKQPIKNYIGLVNRPMVNTNKKPILTEVNRYDDSWCCTKQNK